MRVLSVTRWTYSFSFRDIVCINATALGTMKRNQDPFSFEVCVVTPIVVDPYSHKNARNKKTVNTGGYF